MKGRHGLCVQHIDNLPREKAFFKGPSPLLLSSTSSEDLMFLLLGSDPDTSQVHPSSTAQTQLYHCKSFLLLRRCFMQVHWALPDVH